MKYLSSLTRFLPQRMASQRSPFLAQHRERTTVEPTPDRQSVTQPREAMEKENEEEKEEEVREEEEKEEEEEEERWLRERKPALAVCKGNSLQRHHRKRHHPVYGGRRLRRQQ